MKAVFLDYTGTITQLSGDDLNEMVQRITRNSRVSDSNEMIQWWFEQLHQMEEEYSGDAFETEADLCQRLLERAVIEKGLKDNIQQLKQLNVNYWMYAPLFSDVKPFFEQCTVPIYIISNNAAQYIRINLKRNGLHVNGIIDADSIRCYKPHREIFERALQVSGCSPDEAVSIGDSLSDVTGAQSVGMNCILLDRKKEVQEAPCRIITNLNEALRYL